jgi:hypothetical protein
VNAAQLVRVSFGILRTNRRLLAFPLLSGAALALIPGTAALPGLLHGGSAPWSNTLDLVVLGAGYLLLGIVLTFTSAALVYTVDDVLRGEPARIGTSFRRALRQWRRLLAWSLLSSTVVPLIRQLERIPVVGWILQELFSIGWDVATYLALPAILLDDLGVLAGTRRSARLTRRTFSRSVYGSLWIALPCILAVLTGLVALILGAESDNAALAIAGAAAAALLLAGSLLVGATVSGIFRTALYRDVAATA